jgi:hypothetical protein
MDNFTPVDGQRRSLLTRLLDVFDRWVSTRADERARALGHTVRRIPGTRTHVYRDPRWSGIGVGEPEMDEAQDEVEVEPMGSPS